MLCNQQIASKTGIYYTPVSERTTNTEYVSGVQYSCESRPPLTLRSMLSSIGGTKKRKSAERTVFIANFRRIFA